MLCIPPQHGAGRPGVCCRVYHQVEEEEGRHREFVFIVFFIHIIFMQFIYCNVIIFIIIIFYE